MGGIYVHEFISLDGVIDAPTWTFDYCFRGPRLFPEDAAPAKMSLATCRSYENGVVHLAYQPQA